MIKPSGRVMPIQSDKRVFLIHNIPGQSVGVGRCWPLWLRDADFQLKTTLMEELWTLGWLLETSFPMYYNALTMFIDTKEDCARHIILINVFNRNFDWVSIGSVNFILGATLFWLIIRCKKAKLRNSWKLLLVKTMDIDLKSVDPIEYSGQRMLKYHISGHEKLHPGWSWY